MSENQNLPSVPRWRYLCAAEHGRGLFLGQPDVHRCLSCGYVGTGGAVLGAS